MINKTLIKCILIVATVIGAYYWYEANETWMGYVFLPIGDAVSTTTYFCIIGVVIFIEMAVVGN